MQKGNGNAAIEKIQRFACFMQAAPVFTSRRGFVKGGILPFDTALKKVEKQRVNPSWLLISTVQGKRQGCRKAGRIRFLDSCIVLFAEEGSRFPLDERTTAAGSTTARRAVSKCVLR